MVATSPKRVPNGAAAISGLRQTPHVQLRSPDETVRFLERHPEIESLLVEAADAARSIIAPDTELAFELATIPTNTRQSPTCSS